MHECHYKGSSGGVRASFIRYEPRVVETSATAVTSPRGEAIRRRRGGPFGLLFTLIVVALLFFVVVVLLLFTQ